MKRLFFLTGLFFLMNAFVTTSAFSAGMKESKAGATSGLKTSRATELIGKTVETEDGKRLGAVEDFILSGDGQIQYMVLACEACSPTQAEIGQLVPIPWQAANARTENGIVIVNVQQDKLANAPSFDRDNWPDFSSPDYQQRVFGYYGEEPSATDTQQQMQPSEKLQRQDQSDMQKGY